MNASLEMGVVIIFAPTKWEAMSVLAMKVTKLHTICTDVLVSIKSTGFGVIWFISSTDK